MNIYVGNLSAKTTEEELREAFESFGDVDTAKIIKDNLTGRSRGFGFVEMPNQDQAQAAITGLNGKELGGSPLTVNEAKPRESRGGRSFGGGGRPGGGRPPAAVVRWRQGPARRWRWRWRWIARRRWWQAIILVTLFQEAIFCRFRISSTSPTGLLRLLAISEASSPFLASRSTFCWSAPSGARTGSAKNSEPQVFRRSSGKAARAGRTGSVLPGCAGQAWPLFAGAGPAFFQD